MFSARPPTVNISGVTPAWLKRIQDMLERMCNLAWAQLCGLIADVVHSLAFVDSQLGFTITVDVMCAIFGVTVSCGKIGV